jgi:cytosine/uracil/thiamine/allantoin permease
MAHDPGTGTGTASVAPAESLVPAGFSDRLYNEDLAPAEKRDWGVYSLFCMWMADVHSIGGYTFAAGLFFLGLNGWWVLAGLGVATFVVLGLMNLTGYAGQRLGVPYPVLARLSFGVLGANIPAIIRAIVGIARYGIQTYLASFAVQILLLKMAPGLTAWTVGGFLGLSPLGWACGAGEVDEAPHRLHPAADQQQLQHPHDQASSPTSSRPPTTCRTWFRGSSTSAVPGWWLR